MQRVGQRLALGGELAHLVRGDTGEIQGRCRGDIGQRLALGGELAHLVRVGVWVRVRG